MTELLTENVQAAFTKIRTTFEDRNNSTGLEILTSYEERWAACGTLTDRQIAWIEKQLDGSWLEDVKHAPPKPCLNEEPKSIEATQQDDILALMIDQKLQAQGLTIVRIDDFEALLSAAEKLTGGMRR